MNIAILSRQTQSKKVQGHRERLKRLEQSFTRNYLRLQITNLIFGKLSSRFNMTFHCPWTYAYDKCIFPTTIFKPFTDRHVKPNIFDNAWLAFNRKLKTYTGHRPLFRQSLASTNQIPLIRYLYYIPFESSSFWPSLSPLRVKWRVWKGLKLDH